MQSSSHQWFRQLSNSQSPQITWSGSSHPLDPQLLAEGHTVEVRPRGSGASAQILGRWRRQKKNTRMTNLRNQRLSRSDRGWSGGGSVRKNTKWLHDGVSSSGQVARGVPRGRGVGESSTVCRCPPEGWMLGCSRLLRYGSRKVCWGGLVGEFPHLSPRRPDLCGRTRGERAVLKGKTNTTSTSARGHTCTPPVRELGEQTPDVTCPCLTTFLFRRAARMRFVPRNLSKNP